MDQALKDKFARYIQKTLDRGLKKTQDSILLTEDVVDTVEMLYDMNTEESGIATVPPGVPSPTLDVHPPPPLGAVVLHKDVATDPGEAKSVILMPGDPGFDEHKPADIKRKVFTAGTVRRRAVTGKRPSNLTENPKWDVSDLIALINDNSPDYIEFEPRRLEGKLTLRARKNVLNQAGMGLVHLTYKHDAVSDSAGGGAVEGQPTSLGLLVARKTFSVYDEKQDISAALDEILEQLKAMYKPRPKYMSPAEIGDSPPLREIGNFDTDNLPMGDRLTKQEGQMQKGFRSISDPRASKHEDSILQSSLRDQSVANSRLVPPRPGG